MKKKLIFAFVAILLMVGVSAEKAASGAFVEKETICGPWMFDGIKYCRWCRECTPQSIGDENDDPPLNCGDARQQCMSYY